MLFDQDTIKQIQAIAFDAYKTTGRVAALLDGGGDGNRSLAQEMSAAAFRLERGTVENEHGTRYRERLPQVVK